MQGQHDGVSTSVLKAAITVVLSYRCLRLSVSVSVYYGLVPEKAFID